MAMRASLLSRLSDQGVAILARLEQTSERVNQLLSPANRPLQITSDLPGFWAGSWAEVRKEMAGRYPKHHWPVDPAVAPPKRMKDR